MDLEPLIDTPTPTPQRNPVYKSMGVVGLVLFVFIGWNVMSSGEPAYAQLEQSSCMSGWFDVWVGPALPAGQASNTPFLLPDVSDEIRNAVEDGPVTVRGELRGTTFHGPDGLEIELGGFREISGCTLTN